MPPQPSTSDSPHVLAPPPLIFALSFALGYALQYLFPLPLFQPYPFQIVGTALALLAGILALWGAWTIHHAKTNIDPRKPATSIVTHGPFRFSRNPLYLSMTLLSTGAALVFNLPWALLSLLPTLVIIHHFVIRREERYLESKFGTPYRHYKQTPHRWI
jgi:protein-S-isoprenylcysteine O-methyltransferase Ste14